MKENLQYTAKLAGLAVLTFLKINVPGLLLIGIFSGATLVTLLFQFADGASGAAGAHAGGEAAVLLIFFARPLASSVALITYFASPFLLFWLGNKYIITKLINKVISDKGENILFPLLDKVLNKLQEKQPALFAKGSDKALLKLKMVQEIKQSTENKWFKRIILFALNKVHLSELDLADENMSFNDVIKKSTLTVLKSITEPSRSFFWIICGAQVLVFLLIILRVI
jgi:hypothetical protein